MNSSSGNIRAAADRLESAGHSRVPVPPVRDILGATDIHAAYAVQDELNRRRSAGGARVVGRKIGLTSPAVQKQLGVDQPDFGVLFDEMARADGSDVQVRVLLQPKVEAEVAFVLAKDLIGELDLATVRAAIDHAVAALEIVDSRVANWDITIVDTVADNGSSGLYVLGSTTVSLDEVEPKEVEMSMTVDGEVVSSGNGEACLGDPLNALLWLARTARDYGDPLRAGQIILSGALGPMVSVTAGNAVRAEISGLGTVSINFTDKDDS
jgi:2-keto-4-pentenoate hydratase